jgi:hypothetical protein
MNILYYIFSLNNVVKSLETSSKKVIISNFVRIISSLFMDNITDFII